MSRKVFKDIKRYIHFAVNDNLNTNDKFGKVRKLLDTSNKVLQEFVLFYLYYSTDEQINNYIWLQKFCT